MTKAEQARLWAWRFKVLQQAGEASRNIMAEWVPHFNRARLHASLGPEIPEPSAIEVA